MMAPKTFCAVIFVACALKFGSFQSSCRGRCGAEYYRGYTCQCDYNCLAYDECCQDYESQCTTKNLCKGRCGETFRRGRLCSCDSDCTKFKQCCPDYQNHCDADESTLIEATEEPSFSEGNDADMFSKVSPSDDFNNNGVKDQETTPIPECSSGYGPSTPDLLDEIPTEATLGRDFPEFTTETAFPHTEATPSGDLLTLSPTAGDTTVKPDEIDPTGSLDQDTTFPHTEATTSGDLLTLSPTAGDTTVKPDEIDPTRSPDQDTTFPHTEATTSGDLLTLTPTAGDTTVKPDEIDPTRSPDQNTTLPQPTTAADPNCKAPTSAPEPQTEPTTSSGATEAETAISPSDEPEISTVNTQDSKTVLENYQVTTATPEETTLNLNTQNTENITASLADPKDPSTTIPPTGAGTPTSTDPGLDENTDNVTSEITTADPTTVPSKPTDPPTTESTSKPQDKPDPSKLKPKPDTKPLDPQTLSTDNLGDYQSDDRNDANLCSGRPVSGVTTLRNGTIVVFRGHYFWFLDEYHVPSPPQGITEVWGVPSPIDTVFTRCNCQGKTYILQGGKYWRFENDVLDHGYPKLMKTGFDGLQGHITAALSVPQYQNRKESVYFFKRGGFVQKYSYQFGTSPTCDKTVNYPIYTVRARKVRQAVSVLEPAINIRKSWRGFPSTVTAAVSVPSNREPEGYKYYIFSRSTTYRVRMAGERPVVAAPPPNMSPQSNTFFKCPKTA